MNQVIGREVTITVGEVKYTLSRFDRSILARFMHWANTKLPNPLDVIKDRIKDFPPDLQKVMVREAMDKATCLRSFESPEIQSLIQTVEGAAYLFYLLFQKHHPEVTEAHAEQIYQHCVEEHGEGWVEKQLSTAQGISPEAQSDIEKAYLERVGLLPEKKG
jgi:hypothetical protein